MPSVRLHYRRRPAAWQYMAAALWPSPGYDARRPFPDICARWSGYRVRRRDLDDVCRLCGLEPAGGHLPLLFPHVIGFRLQMAVLTHPRFPIPIWRVLQVRNRFVQHRAPFADAALDFDTDIAAHRVLEKGLEVDLRTCVRADGDLVWESVNTFYVRGRFGRPHPDAPPEAPAPCGETVARWRMAAGGGVRFGSLSGDYNGIHLRDGYARWLGFRRAFFHPVRVLGHALTRLGIDVCADATRLDAWFKGPVYHDSEVDLRAARDAAGVTFALFGGDDPRPAIAGRMYRGVPDALPHVVDA